VVVVNRDREWFGKRRELEVTLDVTVGVISRPAAVSTRLFLDTREERVEARHADSRGSNPPLSRARQVLVGQCTERFAEFKRVPQLLGRGRHNGRQPHRQSREALQPTCTTPCSRSLFASSFASTQGSCSVMYRFSASTMVHMALMAS